MLLKADFHIHTREDPHDFIRYTAVELLQEAWIQGRPIGFDGRDIEDVHSDPAFESLREFVPYQALMRTD